MTTLSEALQRLQTHDLIALKDSRNLEYWFKHVFTQESVYGSLLRSDRRQLHQQIGEALELILADELEEHSLLLAYHFEQGGDSVRAIKYLTQVARQAGNNYANEEARELYTRILALLDKNDYRTRWQVLADREIILDRSGDRDQQANDLTLMQTLAELTADEMLLVNTHMRRAVYFDKISEYLAAAEAAAVALRLARQTQDARLEARSLNLLALAAWRRFDYREVQNWANQALDALRIVGDPADRIISLLHLGRASYRLGQYDAALDYIRAAQELARDTDSRDYDALADLIFGWIYQRLGDYEAAEEHLKSKLAKRRLIGDRYGEATALSHLGWVAFDQEAYEPGLAYCQTALDISREINDRENEAYALSGLALNYEGQGDLNMATSTYRQSLAIHTEIGATTLAVFDQAGLARIALAQQNLQVARDQITAVTDWILAGNAQQFWDPWIIYLSAAEILTALNETETAYSILDEAHSLLHQRAKEIGNHELRQCFVEKVKVNSKIEQVWQQLQAGQVV